MSTDAQGASVFFVFTGTSVELFGSNRPNHGFYQISVDSKPWPPTDGKGPEPGIFRKALFTSKILPNTAHTISLTNANGGAAVDLDYVRFLLHRSSADVANPSTSGCRSLGRRLWVAKMKNSSSTPSKTLIRRSSTTLRLPGRRQTNQVHFLEHPASTSMSLPRLYHHHKGF